MLRPFPSDTEMNATIFMKRALELARPHHTHPNPRVGAVLVGVDGSVVGEGAHLGVGHPHAEAVALAQAGEAASGATLYTTLEPCNHFGQTPPCTEAIIGAGVATVVAGSVDPDRRVSGEGIARLRQAGITVESGVLAESCESLDPGYFHHRRTGRPRVTWKAAMTLDGQLSAADGSSHWITSEAARLDGHRLRAASDAVMVGTGTLLADDPELTVRIPDYTGPQPRPVVVLGERPFPKGARLDRSETIVIATEDVAAPGRVIVAPDLGAGLTALGDMGILDVLYEGGPRLAAALWSRRLIDAGVFYIGSRIAGGVGRPVIGGVFATIAESTPVRLLSVSEVGGDIRVDWEV